MEKTTKADEMPDVIWADEEGDWYPGEHGRLPPVYKYTRQQEQADGGDYTAWLVEQEENGETLYLQFKDRIYNFTRNADEALHFTRKEDAEDMAKLNSNLKAVEHMWPKPSKPAPVAAPETDAGEIGRDDIYRKTKEAINYLFRELQFCVDTETTPAGYSQAHAEALDGLDRLGQMATRAALKKNVGVPDGVRPHALDISMMMARDICESCGVGRYDDQKVEQIATYIYNCATKGALANLIFSAPQGGDNEGGLE